VDKQKEVIEELIEEARKIVEKKETDLTKLNKMLSRESLIPFAQWKKDKAYTRVCLYEDLDFELILICWNPNSKTAIHNHNKQNCSVFFFDSDFQEVVYCEEGKDLLKVLNVKKGDISTIRETNACHTLRNPTDKPVMSFHLYDKPIKKCEVIKDSEKELGLNWKDLKYDTKLTF